MGDTDPNDSDLTPKGVGSVGAGASDPSDPTVVAVQPKAATGQGRSQGNLPALLALKRAGATGSAQFLATCEWFYESQSRQNRVLELCKAGMGGELNPAAPDFDQELDRLESMLQWEHPPAPTRPRTQPKDAKSDQKDVKSMKISNIFEHLDVNDGYNGGSEPEEEGISDEEDDPEPSAATGGDFAREAESMEDHNTPKKSRKWRK